MKRPPSFGRFLLTMVFLLEGLTLAIVIGFLFAMLDRSIQQEQASRANVQQAELRLYLADRLNYTFTRVNEIRSNNNIKIGLLVGMHSKIVENLHALYPHTVGSTFYVRIAGDRYLPQPVADHGFLYDTALFPSRAVDVTQMAANQHTFAYFAPIIHQDQIRGYAVGIYDFSADPNCLKLLEAFKDLSLAYRQGDRFIDLLTRRPLSVPPSKISEAATQSQNQLPSKGSEAKLIGMKEFPSLFLVLDNKQYRQRRRAMVTNLILLCMPLLLLTFTFSFLILKRVTYSLDALAKNALSIAEADEHSNLDTTKVRHAEFLYLTQAFNKVLSKVRQQTDDLKHANDNLQAQIEERRQMAQALQESESQLRSLQDNIPVGLYRRSVDGRIIFANPKLISIFGYDSKDEMMQVPIRDLYDSPQQYDQIMDSFDASSNIQSLEIRLKRKDGIPIWGAVHLKKSNDPKSGTAYIDGAVLDITDRKEIEEENHKLETQLRQAHKMEALGTLAGGIAHDFNNILFATIGFCELALEDSNPDTIQQKNLQDAISCVHRAAELVRQILTFARQSDVEKHPLNLAPILKENLKLLRATLPTSIDIRLEVQNDQTVLADPTQLHQVIVNLCTNAGHAMRETGGLLTIGLEKIDSPPGHSGVETGLKHGAFARLRVSDTGHGMSAETIERIFDPYYTTKPQGEGTGMGLSVVQGIVRSLDGDISVDSAPGKGTTFDIYLPVLGKMALKKHPPMPSVASGREHILFVDDELLITRMVSQMLSNLGYHVTQRNSPIEALELFRRAPDRFDLVLSDVTMPQMAGYDLAREMIKIRSDLPVLLCTGYSESINEKITSRIGVRALLYKPLTRHELSTAIREVLDHRSVA